MSKYSDILKVARKRIESMQDDFICFAIDDAGIGSQRQRDHLTVWVMKLLRTSGKSAVFYGHWIERNHPELIRPHGSFYRQGRLQWLDWMIAHYESKGK